MTLQNTENNFKLEDIRVEDVFAKILESQYNFSDETDEQLTARFVHAILNETINSTEEPKYSEFQQYMIARACRNVLLLLVSSTDKEISEDNDIMRIEDICDMAIRDLAEAVDKNPTICAEKQESVIEAAKNTILEIKTYLRKNLGIEYVFASLLKQVGEINTIYKELVTKQEEAKESTIELKNQLTMANELSQRLTSEMNDLKKISSDIKAQSDHVTGDIERIEQHNKQAEEHLSSVKEISNNLLTNSITVIGIFVAIIIATFGSFHLVDGMDAFSSNLILFAVYSIIVALIIFNITGLLLFFIARITGKDFGVGEAIQGNIVKKFFGRYPHLCVPNMILVLILFVLVYINFRTI